VAETIGGSVDLRTGRAAAAAVVIEQVESFDLPGSERSEARPQLYGGQRSRVEVVRARHILILPAGGLRWRRGIRRPYP
jgi:ABC-type methionine transport system ATPase subunit